MKFKAVPMYRDKIWFIEKREGRFHDWVKNKDIWSDEECLKRGRISMVSASFGHDQKEAEKWADELNKREVYTQ